MIEEFDQLDLETEHLQEVIETPPPAQPVVVIQYRTRGVPWYLVLTLMILVALGAVAFYHRVSSRTWRNLPPPTRASSTSPPALTASPPAPAAPLALNSLPISPDALAGIQNPPAPKVEATKTSTPTPTAPFPESAKTGGTGEPTKAASTVSTPSVPTSEASSVKQTDRQLASAAPADTTNRADRKPMAVGFSVPKTDDSPFAELDISRGKPGSTVDRQPPPASTTGSDTERDPAADADAKPTPTEEQLRKDLEAEAAEKAAELRQRREIKDRARDVLDAEAQTQVEDERAAFRRDLREAIKLPPREASVQIDNLCDRYGRNYSDDLRKRATSYLFHNGGKLNREGKVRVLRLFGVPEAGILDFLANEIHRSVNSRNGPRDSNEVRRDAAMQLLRFRLTKDSGGASNGLQAQRVRTATPVAPGYGPGNQQAP